MKNDRTRVLLALGSLYVIWGSTFLAIRIALQGYPPLLLAGLRFVIAGAVTYAWARARRSAADADGVAIVADRGDPAGVRERLRRDRRTVGKLRRRCRCHRLGAALGRAVRRVVRALAVAGRVGGTRGRSGRSGDSPDRGRSARQPRGSRGPDGELRELGAGIDLEPPPAAAEGADGERSADAVGRNGAAPLRRAARRTDTGRADRAGDAGARVSDRSGLDRRIQRLSVSALAR